eukprot:2624744-Heterocapsa_arctica.AAC.1
MPSAGTAGNSVPSTMCSPVYSRQRNAVRCKRRPDLRPRRGVNVCPTSTVIKSRLCRVFNCRQAGR